jgi:hypothetical protein
MAILCNVCKEDKGFTDYYVTGHSAYNVCKKCLDLILEKHEERND